MKQINGFYARCHGEFQFVVFLLQGLRDEPNYALIAFLIDLSHDLAC